jgi:hypothetical protein
MLYSQNSTVMYEHFSFDKVFKLKHYAVAVRYHEDRCTKNKCMIWIPMLGLFLTCTDNSFFILHTHIN